MFPSMLGERCWLVYQKRMAVELEANTGNSKLQCQWKSCEDKANVPELQEC